MLKANFKDAPVTIEKAVDIFRGSVNAWQKIVVQNNQIAGDNQAVMSVIGIMSDMEHDSLVSVTEIMCDDQSLIENVKELPLPDNLLELALLVDERVSGSALYNSASRCKNRGQLKSFFNQLPMPIRDEHSDVFRRIYFQLSK